MTRSKDEDLNKMPKALLVVDASIDPAVEQEWNNWYNNKHLPEILACPYFDAGARYISDGEDGRKYLTVYRLSSEDAVKTPEFARARGWDGFKDNVRASTRLYTLMGRGSDE